MKKTALFLAIVLIITTCFTGCGNKEEKTLDIPEIQYEVPEWYRDAKFGIFIHYGVYSVPAYGDEWYGHWMYSPDGNTYGGDNIYDYHKATYGGAEKTGYKDFIPDFVKGITTWQSNNGAEQWAELFNEAGAKYVVPVGIHHDSFALYNSDIQTTYNSVTAANVDYLGLLKEALAQYEIKFGISNHFAENDWFFDETYGEGTDMVNPEYAELYGTGGSKTKEHIEKWYAISMEIIDKYQPDLIYYDFDLENDALNRYENANRYLMLQNYYEKAKTWDGNEGVVCNYKHSAFTTDIAVLDKEREALGSINPIPWQTDTSVGAKAWGYIADEEYRSGEEFITALIDIVSKNGNLLLNVNPKADGTIPDETQAILRTIGNWLSTYGDAIYATRPWTVYGEGDTQNSGDSYKYTGKDIRFTKSKDDKHLYISILGEAENNTVTVNTLNKNRWNAEAIETVALLDGNNRIELEWKQTDSALEIILPDGIDGACSVDVTFKNDGTIPKLVLSASDMISTFGETEFLLDFNGDESILVSDIAAEAEGKIKVYSDGKLLCEIDAAKEEWAINPGISVSDGVHKITFDIPEGLNIENFRFCKSKSADGRIEAESCDLLKGSVRAEPCAEGGENLGYVEEGDYVCFAGVDFADGKDKITVRLAGSGQSCNIRIDSPDGKILCKVGGEDTGGWTEYKSFEYDIPETSGVHNLYFTYDTGDSSLNINWFELS